MHALGYVRHPEHGFWSRRDVDRGRRARGIPNAETVAAIEELEAGGGRVLDGPADEIIETFCAKRNDRHMTALGSATTSKLVS
jgi:hypothetical protein